MVRIFYHVIFFVLICLILVSTNVSAREVYSPSRERVLTPQTQAPSPVDPMTFPVSNERSLRVKSGVGSYSGKADLDDTIMQKYRTIGHTYRSEGRLELARQYFEMALAACNTDLEKELLRRELTSVDNLIKIRR